MFLESARLGPFAFATLAVLAQAGSAPAASPVTLEVVAAKFHFEPRTLEVSEGDTVTIVLRSADVAHGFSLKPFGVKLKVPKGGASVSVRFVADRSGTFQFSCSEYCGPGHSQMKGTLVVKPRAE